MSSVDMSVKIAGIRLKNPVMTASGTFGFGEEYGEYYDLNRLGAVVVKGLTLKSRKGNPPPGLQRDAGGDVKQRGAAKPGVDVFLERTASAIGQACVIANISGASVDEYCLMMEKLSKSGVAAVELNLSCPNVKEGGIAFGLKPGLVYEVTRRVKECGQKPVIVKLSPNVTDIVEIAQAAEEGGGDAVSLINTLLAMDIDIWSRRPVLGNTYGGLSGPAVKPVALRMVHQVAEAGYTGYRYGRNTGLEGCGAVFTCRRKGGSGRHRKFCEPPGAG